MPIRANWLISCPRREYEVVLAQAFIFLFAERDFQVSVKSKFPLQMQQQLRETMTRIKGADFKEEVKADLKEKWKKRALLSTFEEEVGGPSR